MNRISKEGLIEVLKRDRELLNFLEEIGARYNTDSNEIIYPDLGWCPTKSVIFTAYSHKYPDLFKIMRISKENEIPVEVYKDVYRIEVIEGKRFMRITREECPDPNNRNIIRLSKLLPPLS